MKYGRFAVYALLCYECRRELFGLLWFELADNEPPERCRRCRHRPGERKSIWRPYELEDARR